MKTNNIDLSEFVPIKDHEDYLVSPDGRIYSTKRKRLLKPFLHRNYYEVNLDYKVYQLHRIVAETFLKGEYGFDEYDVTTIKHIDGDTTNNHVNNLSWGSSRKDCRKIVCLDLQIGAITIFPSVSCVDKLGLHRQGVYKALHGITKHYNKCKWFYYDDFLKSDLADKYLGNTTQS